MALKQAKEEMNKAYFNVIGDDFTRLLKLPGEIEEEHKEEIPIEEEVVEVKKEETFGDKPAGWFY